MSQPPRSKQPVRPVSSRPPTRPAGSTRPSGTGSGRNVPPPPRRTSERPRYVEQKRDPFPYIMGGIIGAMIVGLMAVIWLLTQQNNNNPGPVAAVTPGVNTGATIMSEQTAPRMPIDEFKALYDNPATRPIIIDVRAKQAYDEGHIVGAISFPEADVPARVAELPKDKLIIAYCQ
jgi:hypothetical protein